MLIICKYHDLFWFFNKTHKKKKKKKNLSLKGKFSSGEEGALASKFKYDFE